MEIRYSKAMALACLVIGGVLAGLYFIGTPDGDNGTTLVTVGFIGILLGALFFTRTYCVLNEDSLVVNAILGPGKTIYEFESLKELVVEDNKIFLVQNGNRQKINISVWMIEKKDWLALQQKINQSS
jgi:hypothetical protein